MDINFGKSGVSILCLVVLASFLMPWVSVSCGAMELVSVSPLDIVTDAEVGGADFGDVGAREMAEDGPDGYPDLPWWVVIAGIAAVIGLLSFLMPRSTRVIIPAVGIASLVAFYIRLSMLESEMLREMRADMPNDEWTRGFAELFAASVDISVDIGFWVALAAFIAAVGVALFVKEK